MSPGRKRTPLGGGSGASERATPKCLATASTRKSTTVESRGPADSGSVHPPGRLRHVRHDGRGLFLVPSPGELPPRPERRQVGHRDPVLPLGDGLLVDPVALGQNPQTLLTMLYRSTDRLCRRGASVQYLAHKASIHSAEKIAPPNSGTKHPRRPTTVRLRDALSEPDR